MDVATWSVLLAVLALTRLTEGYSVEEGGASHSPRQSKLLFTTGPDLAEVRQLRERLERLEEGVLNSGRTTELQDIRERVTRLEGGVPGGYETFEDAKKNFTMVWSNITNIYSKVKVLRAADKLKCSVKKCDNIRTKLKKVQKEVEFLKNLNMTQVEMAITQISTFTSTISTLQANVVSLTDNATKQQVEINSLNTKVTSLESTVTAMTDNATKQQVEINTLKTEVVTLQTGITTNKNTISEHRNCFLDIYHADCPTAKRRSGRDLDENHEEEEKDNESGAALVIEDYDDFNLGPHPSIILKDIFRSNKLAEMKSKFQKKKKKKKKEKYVTRQTSTTSLVGNVKILIACMTDPSSTQCGTLYRSDCTGYFYFDFK